MEDGYLNDPRDCGFVLSDLPPCSGSESADHCLTICQREAIAAIYGGPRNADGQIYPGLPFGGKSAARTRSSPVELEGEFVEAGV